MERLTIEKCGELLIKNNDNEYRSPCFGCESINKCNPEKTACGFYKALEKLKEYEDLEKQGKLLKLPCAIGDEIFFIFRDCPKDYKKEYCRDHEGSCENCHHRVAEIVSRDFILSDIRNLDNIFTTREEAEAALKGVGK